MGEDIEVAAAEAVVAEPVKYANEVKLFGRWSYADVKLEDVTLTDYIAIRPKDHVFLPHTAGRYQVKKFRKATCPVVERLVAGLMFHGRNSGKKQMAIRIVQAAFEIINLQLDENPIQILIKAIENAGPREDSTRVGSAGVVRRQAVDLAPFRRVNQAIFFLAIGAREASFRTIKTVAECLADEIVNAAKGSSSSFAIKKKDEIERVAKVNR